MNTYRGRPIRSVRISDKRWAGFKACCGLKPTARASITFRRIFKVFDDYGRLQQENNRLLQENQYLKDLLRRYNIPFNG